MEALASKSPESGGWPDFSTGWSRLSPAAKTVLQILWEPLRTIKEAYSQPGNRLALLYLRAKT